jgi:hypothetical protein
MLLDFNAKVEREDIIKPTITIWNESLHEISIDNVVRLVNFATSETLNCQEYNVPTSQYS